MQNAIPATIQKVQTMVRHARIIVDTQENLTPEQLAELFALHEKVGYFFFLKAADSQIKTDDLPRRFDWRMVRNRQGNASVPPSMSGGSKRGNPTTSSSSTAGTWSA